MRDDCDICGGIGKIRLPIQERLTATISNDCKSMPIREYSCPECGDKIPYENILVVQGEQWVDAEIKDPEFLIHCKQSITHKMGSFLHNKGMITFVKNRDLTSDYSYREGYFLRGQLGVVSPRIVATLEQRIQEKQRELAAIFIQGVAKKIRNWRECFNDPLIEKDMAIRFLYQVLEKIK